MSLTKKSISECIKWLDEYSKSLENKTQRFVSELTEIGITVAREKAGNTGRYGTHKMEDRIVFSKKTEPIKNGTKGLVIGEGETFISTWDNGNKSEEVFPLHMIEYGTNHNGSMDWGFIDNEGKLFQNATGIEPTQPMHNAYVEMRLQIIEVAKRVFGS